MRGQWQPGTTFDCATHRGATLPKPKPSLCTGGGGGMRPLLGPNMERKGSGAGRGATRGNPKFPLQLWSSCTLPCFGFRGPGKNSFGVRSSPGFKTSLESPRRAGKGLTCECSKTMGLGSEVWVQIPACCVTLDKFLLPSLCLAFLLHKTATNRTVIVWT